MGTQGNTRFGSTRYSTRMGWIVLLYRLPSSDSRARVAVWRELRRSGALHLPQSVVAVPDADAFASVVDELRAVIADVGGQLTALHTVPAGDDDQQRIVEAWNSARDDEYRELAGECAKFLAEIDHEFEKEKFTLAELDEEEAELEKLQSWHARIRTRDVHGAPGAAGAERGLEQAAAALERYSTAVFEHTQPS
jgi:DNA-binding transcriptional regulator PaaX